MVNLAVNKCAGRSGRPPQELTEDQRNRLKKAIEARLALAKELESVNKEVRELLESVKKCKKCLEKEYSLVLCDEHFERLMELNKKGSRIQVGYQLKQQLGNIK